MAKWRKYRVGRFALGQLNGQAVVRYRDENGIKRRRILGAKTEAEARAQLDRFVRRREVIIQTEGGGPTVGDLFALYVKDREQDGKLVDSFRWNWKALQGSFADLQPHSVNADVCRSYAKLRVSAGRSQGTIWTELTRLRSCLNWAVKRRVIVSAGYVWIPSKPKVKPKELTEQQVLRLIDGCVMPHLRLFVILAFATGGRTTAILELTWDRVDFDAGTIDLRLVERENPLSKASKKGRAAVPMNNLARAALLEAKAISLTEHVIEWNEAPVLSIRTGFNAACRRAGLSGVTPHCIRHTTASLALDKDQPMELIARFLGHRDVQTTARIYARPSISKLKGVADAVDLAAIRTQKGQK